MNLTELNFWKVRELFQNKIVIYI